MPTEDISINLIGEEEMDHTPVGRIVTWAVTYGRYIMIGTEIVVLLAFISRFSLDRKLTDLNDEISQKQAIIEANADFEQQFRVVQNQLDKIRSLMNTGTIPVDALSALGNAIPSNVYLDSLDIASDKLTAHAVAGSSGGFASFITNLQAIPLFKNIDIGDVRQNTAKGVEFQFVAALK